MIGQQLGGYVIERCIGDGGMGSVYLGVKAKNGERAAIKILRPELARSAEMVQRILREGRAAGCISHPGIVKILESGLTPKGSPYIIMEYLEGQPLSAYLQERRKLPVAEALRIGQELAAALLAAHAKHVIHRDLKPDKVTSVEKSVAAVRAPSLNPRSNLDALHNSNWLRVWSWTEALCRR
jgi:serine/threonine protein kinase